MHAWLVDPESQQAHRDDRRDDGDPQHHAQVARPQSEEQHGQQGAGECPDGVERLAQSVGGIAQMRRRHVGDDGISWRTVNALADPIDESR